jgi:thiol-disulfide isomerase/thioredoxin
MYAMNSLNSTIVYVACSVLFVIALIGRVVLKAVFISEDLLLAVHTLLLIIESLKQYEEYLSEFHDKYKHVKDTVNQKINDLTAQAEQQVQQQVQQQIGTGLSTEHFGGNVVQLVLLKAEWCSACKQYLASESYQTLQKLIMSHSLPVLLKVYDIDKDTQKYESEYKIQKNSIKFVPTLLFNTCAGIMMFKDNIYDNNKIMQTIMDVFKKSN